jgi:23S rRNA (adenine2030-N6)-methyltransferase
MFSYRHAFHAGNHADVLKHTVLIATLDHLLEKEAALTVVDTHAGAGLYRLDGDYADTSGEAADGILRLLAPRKSPPHPPPLQSRRPRKRRRKPRPRWPTRSRATSA